MRYILALLLIFNFILADAHIFVYHRFDDPRHKSSNISTKILRKHFDYFILNGYTVVPLSKIVERLKNGEEIPKKWIALVIDDGYKSFYYRGLPVFAEYNFPFTLFVYVEASSKRYGDYMNFDQIKEVLKFGDVQYHSYAHPHMVGLNDEKLTQDFNDGVATFEKYMGYKPKYFAYPYGEYDQKVLDKAKSFGFEALLNQNSGAVSGKSDRFDLYRTPLKDETELKVALADEYLDAEWTFSEFYKKSQILDEISIKFDDLNATKAKFFITGQRDYVKMPVKNGVFYYKFPRPLDRYKTRISLKIGKKTTTKILVKDINNVE
ncbi:MAG: polysaccharide deacetylase family protein [Campylobacter sp.]|nr:polysaccharide deacetylase family protein [Campylobacter sp.]